MSRGSCLGRLGTAGNRRRRSELPPTKRSRARGFGLNTSLRPKSLIFAVFCLIFLKISIFQWPQCNPIKINRLIEVPTSVGFPNACLALWSGAAQLVKVQINHRKSTSTTDCRHNLRYENFLLSICLEYLIIYNTNQPLT